MRKTIEELRKLNTKNLLRYYKAERLRWNCAISSYHYGFDAVDYMWNHSDNYENERIEYEGWKDYLCLIKTELNTREHVSKNCL
jgi:hypothetical protein